MAIFCVAMSALVVVADSLKTSKSVHIKCAAKSKRRRVYSSNAEYAWLL